VRSGWAEEELILLLAGTTRDELGGSEWAHVVHGHLGGLPPQVDLPAERALAGLLETSARLGLLAAAHDLSEGGLAQGLAEGCLRHGVGAEVDLAVPAGRDGLDAFTLLFSESTARVLLAVPAEHLAAVRQLADEAGAPLARLGRTTGADLAIRLGDEPQLTIPVQELRAVHTATLPAAFHA
jgi:phosphoribosylformylglycinamidine synthase